MRRNFNRRAAPSQGTTASNSNASDDAISLTRAASLELNRAPNRCADCGQFVGETFTSYDNDRMSDRGRLWCDRCIQRQETAP
jgi:hypothetical protein